MRATLMKKIVVLNVSARVCVCVITKSMTMTMDIYRDSISQFTTNMRTMPTQPSAGHARQHRAIFVIVLWVRITNRLRCSWRAIRMSLL